MSPAIALVLPITAAGFLIRAYKGGWYAFGQPEDHADQGGRAALLYAGLSAVILAALAYWTHPDWLAALLALPAFFAAYFVPGRWLPHNPGQQMTAWWHPLQLSAEGYVEALAPLLVVACVVALPWRSVALVALPGLLVGPLYWLAKRGYAHQADRIGGRPTRLWALFRFPRWRLGARFLIDWWSAWGERLPGLWLLGAPAALLLIHAAR